jgi:hypothetical protein
LGGVCSLA